MEHQPDPTSTPDELLIRDPLTGSYTRGLLEPRLTEELARAEREISPLVVCHFDLDGFRDYNLEQGPEAGDQVLRDATQWTYQSIRSSDLLFRSGGDEFVLVLPSTTREQAMVVCQRILERFAQGPVSISMGVASYPEDGDDTLTLLLVAQKRQQEARSRGTGQFVTHEQGESPRIYFNTQMKPVEREEQFSALEAFLGALPEHRQGVLLLDSEPGSGRTFFLRKAAMLAQQQNYLVLPLMYSGTPEGTQTLAETQVLQGLLDEVEHAAKTGLLVLYDAAVAVPPQVLGQVLTEHDNSRALGIIAVGEPDAAPAVSLSQVISLPPFTVQGLHRWVRDVFHWDAPLSFIELLHESTEGFPGRAEQHLKSMLAQGKLQYTGGTWTVQPEA
ncbi:GGDEF domain-containing protein [Deinococcus cellulosilyticus]|uniref:GGDEF domain-containing protein n=1 Tax=Deinococcus cellulosilyticus (strain DSM 18568 / NBRC 106333 / KACC 11606 / 5516J-15) TaxID=1223518 RepID=A0A511N0S5_DEIC1|nr:diguanylate cyclase [Deinococcus cellulosilyticus]GEM46463.1 hypothetical protein DC3_20980 [Deinococcus cellulosilyticus NBRC 106333 = KACC 11606]